KGGGAGRGSAWGGRGGGGYRQRTLSSIATSRNPSFCPGLLGWPMLFDARRKNRCSPTVQPPPFQSRRSPPFRSRHHSSAPPSMSRTPNGDSSLGKRWIGSGRPSSGRVNDILQKQPWNASPQTNCRRSAPRAAFSHWSPVGRSKVHRSPRLRKRAV